MPRSRSDFRVFLHPLVERDQSDTSAISLPAEVIATCASSDDGLRGLGGRNLVREEKFVRALGLFDRERERPWEAG